VATLDECLTAVAGLSGLLQKATDGGHVKDLPDRVVALELTDLGQTVTGALRGNAIVDVAAAPTAPGPADATLRCTSDTLLALCNREIGFPVAWATGKLQVEAGIRDLMRLRSLL
jgi:hypothetical protein